METAKTILEKALKITVVVCILMGLVSAVFLMILHIKAFPIEVIIYSKEITLSLCLFIIYILVARFGIKHFKTIAAVALLISIFNLLGFKILIKLLRV